MYAERLIVTLIAFDTLRHPALAANSLTIRAACNASVLIDQAVDFEQLTAEFAEAVRVRLSFIARAAWIDLAQRRPVVP